jgi:hypothetical protein
MCDTLPSKANMRVWPSEEKNGVISVWMSSTIHKRAKPTSAHTLESEAASKAAAEAECADGSRCDRDVTVVGNTNFDMAKNVPLWHVPDFPKIDKMHYHGYAENIVNALLFEIPENGSDVAHLPALHNTFILDFLSPPLSHLWDASWRPSDSRKHIADIEVNIWRNVLAVCAIPFVCFVVCFVVYSKSTRDFLSPKLCAYCAFHQHGFNHAAMSMCLCRSRKRLLSWIGDCLALLT